MTKQQFLNGERFKVSTGTYVYREDTIFRLYIRSTSNTVLVEDYQCNVSIVTDEGFEGYTFVMGNRVSLEFKFEDLELVNN